MAEPVAASNPVGGPGSVHAWESWAPAWHVVFYGSLAVASALALADPASSWAADAAIAGLAMVLGGWYWLWVVKRRVWTLPLGQVLAYFAGAALLWVTSVSVNDAFFVLAFSAYQQVASYLPSSRGIIAGILVLTGVLSVMQLAAAGSPALVFLIALPSAGVAVLLSLWIDAIIRQSQDRHRLIGELEATRADLATAERQAGTLGERQRLAREIHDTLAQGLTSVVMLLEAAEAELDPRAERARRHLDHALRTARETLGESRRFVWALQPEALDRGSLVEAVGRLADALTAETGMAARFVVSGDPVPLTGQAEIALLRAAQEASANIRKHSGASTAVLTLSYTDDRVILDVRDDGRGFDCIAVDGEQGRVDGGLGLRGLRARLAMLGGALEMESTPGEGTVLVAQIPIGPTPRPTDRDP